ncbi:unnamed protein product, partial [Rotaria magnacalcarata]
MTYNRGSPLICLDWCEICDGKIDCLDGGEDEKYCFKLYINQCGSNEYQCRNGTCVNEVFLLETGSRNDPSFRCEDTVCLLPHSFNCSDGNCVQWSLSTNAHYCHNKRDQMFNIE